MSFERDASGAAYVPIQGTNSWADIPLRRLGTAPLWWQSGSPFTTYLQHFGLALLHPERPFIWDTDLAGAILWAKGFRDWQAAGANLQNYFELAQTPLADRNLIAHSHGLQVVLFACAYGLEIRNLVSIGSPVRADLNVPQSDVTALARTRIGFWLHISDPSDDTMQEKGEWFDRSLRVQRTHPLADVNDQYPGIAHSRILYDPAYFHLWEQNNWHAFLTRTSAQADRTRKES